MQKVESLVFRKLTDADFFNINKPAGTERSGGGQSYIDFSTSAVTIRDWDIFLGGTRKFSGTNGPGWVVKILSLGTSSTPQEITIQQRRNTSVSIRSQKLISREAKRVFAWRPDLTGFPKPINPAVRGHIYDLHIYIARLENGEFWAGWFHTSKPEYDWPMNGELNQLFSESEGYVKFNGDVLFDISDPIWPFRIVPSSRHAATTLVVPTSVRGAEGANEKIMFDEDEINVENAPSRVKEQVRRIRIRNSKAVKKLKSLYENQCQISGSKFTFTKRDGHLYSEAHHLIPLGKGGADSVRNIVILSPLIHRMLHYANVEGLDLKKIKNDKLTIKINRKKYTIIWHPRHAEIVKSFS